MAENLAKVWKQEWDTAWASDTLPLQPHYPVSCRYLNPGKSDTFDAGYSQSIALRSYSRRVWEGLQWRALDSTEKTTLISFFEGRINTTQAKGFLWTQPDETQIKVALLEYKAQQEQDAYNRFRVTASFVELFDE